MSVSPRSVRDLARLIDHTLLRPDATTADVERAAAEALDHGCFSLCVAPARVALAARLLARTPVRVISIAGFPLGSTTSALKAAEAQAVVAAGASEVDMVQNVGALKEGDERLVAADIRAVVTASGAARVKVIIETCMLTDAEKRRACELAIDAGAAFVKTSTGFAAAGARPEDVRLMKEAVRGRALVKASAGIRTLDAALAMLEAGADRLGMSASVAILAELAARQHGGS
jgi:deoxyribose-phosphate aldolase